MFIIVCQLAMFKAGTKLLSAFFIGRVTQSLDTAGGHYMGIDPDVFLFPRTKKGVQTGSTMVHHA